MTRWLYCVECPQYSSRLAARGYIYVPWAQRIHVILRLPCYLFTVSNSGLVVFTSGSIGVLVYSILDIGRRRKFRRSILCGQRTGQGNDFELIPPVKLETRDATEIYFSREFWAICNHAELRPSEDARSWKFSINFCFCFFKRPLTVKFSKFCSESLHGDTDRRSGVQKSWTLATGKSAKSCVIYLTDKINSLGSHAGATAWIAPKICRGQPQQSSLSVSNVIQIGSLSAEL